MDLSKRQLKIIQIVKEKAPITGDEIATSLGVSRATIRPDLAVLTMINILGARPNVGYFYTGRSELSLVVDHIKELKIEDYMSVPFVMEETASVYDVIVGLFLEDVSSVFITNNRNLTGVVSRKDLIRTTIGGMDIHNTPISLVMTRMPNLVTIGPLDTAFEGARLIDERGVDSIPVVEEENGILTVVGRFTKTNVNRMFVEMCKGEII